MKNISLIYLFAFLFIASSCSDEFDEGMPNQTSPKDFFQKAENVELIVKGMYISGSNAYYGNHDFMRMRSGLFILNPVMKQIIAENQMNSPLRAMSSIRDWSDYYKAINQCNYILENIDGADKLLQRERNSYKGEAYFMRAFMYWELSKVWGEAPLVLKYNDNTPKAKSTIEVLQNQTEQDLVKAMDLLSTEYVSSETGQEVIGNRTRATKAAAFMLQMNQCYARDDYEGVLAIREKYHEVYQIKNRSFNGWYSDALFELNAESYDLDSYSGFGTPVMDVEKLGDVFESFSYDAELKTFDERATTDVRVKRGVGVITQENSDKVFFYLISGPVFRYADLQLMAVEALLETDMVDDAGAELMKLTDVAYEGNTPQRYTDNISNKDSLSLYLKLETKREHIVSSSVFYDRLRWNEITITDPGKVYLPVGEKAFENNPKMQQNTSWN